MLSTSHGEYGMRVWNDQFTISWGSGGLTAFYPLWQLLLVLSAPFLAIICLRLLFRARGGAKARDHAER